MGGGRDIQAPVEPALPLRPTVHRDTMQSPGLRQELFAGFSLQNDPVRGIFPSWTYLLATNGLAAELLLAVHRPFASVDIALEGSPDEIDTIALCIASS